MLSKEVMRTWPRWRRSSSGGTKLTTVEGKELQWLAMKQQQHPEQSGGKSAPELLRRYHCLATWQMIKVMGGK